MLTAGDGSRLAGNRYLFSGTNDLAPLLDLPPATLDASIDVDRDQWKIGLANGAQTAAVGIVIEDDRSIGRPGWAEADDGWFDLLPGERRDVTVDWAEAPADGRRLRVTAWNLAPRGLEAPA
jgi:hypothetical protein